MRKKIIALVFISALLSAGQAYSAPVIVLDSADVLAGDTSVNINLFIQTDASAPVDTAAFEINHITGFDLTDVSIFAPTNWFPTVNLAANKFGATDFGFPANTITDSNYHFATMTFSFADTFFDSINSVQIAFKSFDLGSDLGVVYSDVPVSGGVVSAPAVPIPGAVWLLGAGLSGLVALRRKNS